MKKYNCEYVIEILFELERVKITVVSRRKNGKGNSFIGVCLSMSCQACQNNKDDVNILHKCGINTGNAEGVGR